MKLGLREALLVVLLIAMPLGAWWYVFKPRNQRDEEMRKQIALKQEKLRALNRMTGTLGDMHKEIDSLKEALAFFQSKLPGEKEIDKVLQEIWQTAEQNDLATKGIKTLSKSASSFTAAAGPHAEQPIDVQLEGDFIGFYNFLQSLEAQQRIMRIEDLVIQKLPRAQEGHMRASFVISVFFEQS